MLTQESQHYIPMEQWIAPDTRNMVEMQVKNRSIGQRQVNFPALMARLLLTKRWIGCVWGDKGYGEMQVKAR
eukprot:UN12165